MGTRSAWLPMCWRLYVGYGSPQTCPGDKSRGRGCLRDSRDWVAGKPSGLLGDKGTGGISVWELFFTSIGSFLFLVSGPGPAVCGMKSCQQRAERLQGAARVGPWRAKRSVKNTDCLSCDLWSQPVIYSVWFIKSFSLLFC